MKEYKVVKSTGVFEAECTLNNFAAEGWRLVSVIPLVGGGAISVQTEYYLLFLERDKK